MNRFKLSRDDLKKRYGKGLEIPAKASRFVVSLKELLRTRPQPKVVLYLRVSSCDQHRKKNLATSERRMNRELAKLGVTIVATFRETGSGWRTDLERRKGAAEHAKEHGAVLVAESSDRFLRSVDYTNHNQSALPCLAEWEAFRDATQGVTVATLLNPDMPWTEVRRYQTRRGIIERRARCGRPRKPKRGDKKRVREKWMRRVFVLRNVWECSYSEIEAETGVPRSTFRGWLEGGAEFDQEPTDPPP